jgi:putative transposase
MSAQIGIRHCQIPGAVIHPGAGATLEGKKELVGFHVGRRESAQSWRELLVALKARGFAVAPEIAVGDGALGFWTALDEVFPDTRHKAANVLNKFPKPMAPTAKSDLRDVWQAETRAVAQAAMDTFAEKCGAKYEKAVACLTRDRAALLAFFDFPAEHWNHLRQPTRSRATSPRSGTGLSAPKARSRRRR